MQPLAGGFFGVAMVRIAFTAAALVLFGTAGAAFAQTNCQPTITQPCAKPADKPSTQAPRRTTATDVSNEPKDHSPRIRLDKDTDFKFGTGGLGLQKKF